MNVPKEPTALKVARLPSCVHQAIISTALAIMKPQIVVFVPLGGTAQDTAMQYPLLSVRRVTIVLEVNKKLRLQNTTAH